MPAVIILLTCLALLGCNKPEKQQLTGKWKIESITVTGNSAEQPANALFLEFIDEDDLTLSLDRNTCNGKYKLPKKGKITVEDLPCTKICCDSEIADKVKTLLPKMTDYSVEGTTLTFNGDGQMLLSQQ